MLKSFGISIGAFFSNPLKFISDPANAIVEYQTKKMVAEGRTETEIEEELKKIGVLKGAGPVKVIIDEVGKGAQFLLDNLPRIFFLFVVLVGAYFALKFVKVLK